MRAAPAEAFASPLIARKSQRIFIANALSRKGARSHAARGSRIEMNSALSHQAGHYLAEQAASAQASLGQA
jgi:hypothetical protein